MNWLYASADVSKLTTGIYPRGDRLVAGRYDPANASPAGF
jgi:hypothetical protein